MLNQYKNKMIEIFKMAEEVHRQTGRSYLTQAQDIRKLCRANSTCRIWDYYKLGIYQHENVNARLARSYLGESSLAAASVALNPRHAVTAAWDKLVFDMIAQLHDLPTAHNMAVFKPASALPSYIPQPLHTRKKPGTLSVQSIVIPLVHEASPCTTEYWRLLPRLLQSEHRHSLRRSEL